MARNGFDFAAESATDETPTTPIRKREAEAKTAGNQKAAGSYAQGYLHRIAGNGPFFVGVD